MPSPASRTDSAKQHASRLLDELQSQWKLALSHVLQGQPDFALMHIDKAEESMAQLDPALRACPDRCLAELRDRLTEAENLHRELLLQSRNRRDSIGRDLDRNRRGQSGLKAYGETLQDQTSDAGL